MYNGKCIRMFTEASLIEVKNWKQLLPTQTVLCSSDEISDITIIISQSSKIMENWQQSKSGHGKIGH